MWGLEAAQPELGVSVKLAHELLTGLAQRGLLHVRKLHSRRWDYFLTPTGVAEKARLTFEFLDFTMQFYRSARRQSAEVLSKAAKGGVKRIAFLGANELAEIASLGAQEWHLQVVDIFDDTHAGEESLGVKVRPISELDQSDAERILVTAFDPREPMARRYLPKGIDDDERFLWIFDVPDDVSQVPEVEADKSDG